MPGETKKARLPAVMIARKRQVIAFDLIPPARSKRRHRGNCKKEAESGF